MQLTPYSDHRDPLSFDPFLQSGSPEVWLTAATSAGILLLHLAFAKPYFLLHFYVWQPRGQLPEALLPEEVAFRHPPLSLRLRESSWKCWTFGTPTTPLRDMTRIVDFRAVG